MAVTQTNIGKAIRRLHKLQNEAIQLSLDLEKAEQDERVILSPGSQSYSDNEVQEELDRRTNLANLKLKKETITQSYAEAIGKLDDLWIVPNGVPITCTIEDGQRLSCWRYEDGKFEIKQY